MTTFNEKLNRFKLRALLESVRNDMINYLKGSDITDSEATQLVDDFNKAKDKGMIKLDTDRNLQLWMKKPALDFKKFVNELKNIKSNTELRTLTKNEGAELVFEDNYWYVYHIKNYDACKIYGSGTKWCITQKSCWEEYTEDWESIFYFIISKVLPDTDPYYKIAARVESDFVEYYISDDDEVSRKDIISYLNRSDITFPKVSILKYIRPICKRYGVTSTPDGEFIIPNGVTSIGDYTFSGSQLTSVTIPNSVTHIGDGAFEGNKLIKVTIPNSVTEIGENAFHSNKLTNVTIPNSVKEISDYAFWDNKLTSVDIPNSVTKIGYGAFARNKLTSVTIPNSVTEISTYAFAYNELTSVDIPNSVKEIGAAAFNGNNLTSVTIPNSVTKIGDYAFYGNELTSVVIPNSVTEIGEEAFDDGVEIIINEELNRFKLKALLESVRIDMVNYLKDSGITDSEAIQLVDDFNKAKDKGMIKLNTDRNLQLWMKKPALDFKKFVNELKNIKSNTEVRALTKNEGAELVFEDDYWYVYHIKNYDACKIYGSGTKWCITQKSHWKEYTEGGKSTFYFIISKVLPDTDPYYKIAAKADSDGVEYYISNDDEVSRKDIISYLNLSDITFPKESILKYIRPICNKYGTTSTPDGEFIIPNGVIKIGKGMFKDAQLIKVIIPDSVTSIGDYAFVGNELTKIDIPGSVTSIGEFAFTDNKLNTVDIPGSITKIGNYAFRNNLINSVNISDGVTEIGDYAFDNNYLTEVVIPSSVKVIGHNAFAYNNLSSVKIPNSVTEMGDYAFVSNYLTEVVIPSSVKVIGHKAFSYNNLSSVKIPNSVKVIGHNAFANNILTDVTISDGVTIIGNYAFAGNQLPKVKIPDSVTKIGGGAFMGNKISSVYIPDSVTEIGYYAFDPNVKIIRGKSESRPRSKNESINSSDDGDFSIEDGVLLKYNGTSKDVVIPDGITEIGKKAFYDNQLTSVTIPNSVTEIGGGAFFGNELTGVTVPSSVTKISDFAFKGNNLSRVVIPSSITEIGDYAFDKNVEIIRGKNKSEQYLYK